MKEITYFYRNRKLGYSIGKVFRTITKEISISSNVKEYEVPYYRASMFSIFKNIYFVFKNRNKTGINHITGDIHYCIIALIGCRSILTIHDTSAYDCAKNPIKKILIFFLWFYIPLKISNKIVCISEHTKNELKRFTNRKDIEVILNPLDSNFTYKPKEFLRNNPTILLIGTAWNKNFDNTVKALKSIKCHLRIIGKITDNQEILLHKLNINYSIVSNLSDEDVIKEYENCDMVVFCSIYEGFGMPIIEGNAVGRNVITSNLSPMTEIGGTSACYANPHDVKSIKSAIINIINDENYRNTLIKNGMSNIMKHRVNIICDKYRILYNSL